MERLETAIEKQFCQTRYGRVCYWIADCHGVTPAGEAGVINLILFLHGVGGSGRYWFPYLEELEGRGPKAESRLTTLALAPDLLGFGLSDKPDLDYTPEVQLGVLEAVLAHALTGMALTQTATRTVNLYLVGHSMGGILAVLLAAQVTQNPTLVTGFPLDLKAMTLLATPYASPGNDMDKEVLRSVYNRAMLTHPLVCQVVHHSIKFAWPLVLWLTKKGFLKVGLPLPVVADYMEHTCHSYISNAQEIVFHSDLTPALEVLGHKKNQLPTLLVYSQGDKDVPLRHGQEMAARLLGSRLVVLENERSHQGLGHTAKDLVMEFLSRQSSS